MKALNLIIHNVCRIEHAEIDLSGLSLVSIVGVFTGDVERSNGASKTTIVEAPFYAITGKCRTKSDKDLRRKGSDGQFYVDFTFELSGDTIRIKRGRNANNTAILDVEVNGVTQGKNIREKKKYIEEVVGVNADIAQATWYFVQGKADLLTCADPSVRKDYLSAIVGLDEKYESLKVVVNSKFADTKTQKLAAEDFLTSITAAKHGEQVYKEYVESQEALVDSRKANIQFLKEQIADNEKDHNKLVRLVQSVETEQYAVSMIEASKGTLEQSIKSLSTNPLPEPESLESFDSRVVEANQIMDTLRHKWSPQSTDSNWVNDMRDQKGQVDSLCMLAAKDYEVANKARKAAEDLQNKVKCDSCGRELTPELQMRVYQQRKMVEDAALFKMNELKITLVQWNDYITGAEIDILANSGKLRVIKEVIEERYKLGDQIELYNKQIKQRDDEINRLSKDLERLEFDRQEHLGTLQSYQNQYNELNENPLNNDDLKVQLKSHEEAYETEYKNYLAGEQQYEALQASIIQEPQAKEILTGWAREEKVCKVVNELFHRDGLPLQRLKLVCKKLEYHANEMLALCSDNLEINIICENDDKGKGILDFKIKADGHVREYNSYSGGEKKLVDVCLRLALSKFLANRVGKRYECLFLDEIFADLDAKSRQSMLTLLKSIQKDFKQIFVISHVQEVQESLPQTIVVTRDGEISKVKVI